jgi:UDP-glucose 4-epimerase
VEEPTRSSGIVGEVSGFIGSHTTRALLDLGESCVLVQRRAASAPDLFANETGERVLIEQADVADRPALLEVGKRHQITGIINLAGNFHLTPNLALNPGDPVGSVRTGIDGMLNVLQAALDWQVPRVGLASTIGVYDAGDGLLREDLPLPLAAAHPIPAAKKVQELLSNYLGTATALETYNVRIGAAWGPLGRTASPFNPVPQLVHAAVRGTLPDFSTLRSAPHAQDGLDLVYVRDCGRAIALLQLAGTLRHRVYNVASGRTTTNQEVTGAIEQVLPGVHIDLPAGRDPKGSGRDLCLDIGRLREDTDYQPDYDIQRAVADYVGWLRAGHQR